MKFIKNRMKIMRIQSVNVCIKKEKVEEGKGRNKKFKGFR